MMYFSMEHILPLTASCYCCRHKSLMHDPMILPGLMTVPFHGRSLHMQMHYEGGGWVGALEYSHFQSFYTCVFVHIICQIPNALTAH